MKKRTLLGRLAAAAVLAFVPTLAAAQAWPSKPVKIVVPFNAGGATDVVAERGAEGVARVMDLLDGVGADAALECVGTKESMQQALDSARPGGRVGYVGVPAGGPELPVQQMFSSNVGVLGGVAPAADDHRLPGELGTPQDFDGRDELIEVDVEHPAGLGHVLQCGRCRRHRRADAAARSTGGRGQSDPNTSNVVPSGKRPGKVIVKSVGSSA